MTDIYHLHINTANDSFTNNNYRVNLPSNNLILNDDSYLQINNFFCIKNWYNLQIGYNDKYIVYINGVENEFSLGEGNPRVTDIVRILNTYHSTYLTCSYDYMRNKIFFRNISNDTVIIKPINCGRFISLFDDLEYEVSSLGDYGNHVVNVSGDSTLLIHIVNSDFALINPSMDNLNQTNGTFNESSIVLALPINVPPFGLISYSSSGDDLDRIKIAAINQSVQGFNIYITNEHGAIIPNLTDYTISITFLKNISQNNTSKVIEILNDIFIMIGNFISEFKNRFF